MTDSIIFHPGLVLIVGAFLLPWLQGKTRDVAVTVVPLLALALVWQIPDGAVWKLDYLGYELSPLQGDKLSRLFATIFALMASVGGLYALTQKSRLEIPAAFIYAGSAIGVALAGDLITVFVFWEMMAVGSTLVLWSQGSTSAYRAARRYLMVHLLGGVILFAGITGHIVDTGSVSFTQVVLDSPAHWLMLIGFLINAAAPPFSAWLADAYPEASWSGAVFLSAFTTKTAVYVLIRGFPGTELLIWLGLFMVFYGIVYALLENDIRRLLAYSIVSQVGFMVTAIGIGSEMALNGASAHAFAHIIYKGLLLMVAGSVLRMTGKRRFSDLGGLIRSMPVTATFCMVGAMAVSAFPLTSGFATKSMLSVSAAQAHLSWVWIGLTGASACTFLYAGLKFTWFIFLGEDKGLRPSEPPSSMRWAMLVFAVLCVAIGVWPDPLYALLPYPVAYQPYTWPHVLEQLQLLMFTALAFLILLPNMKRLLGITLDWDWIWRRFIYPPSLKNLMAPGSYAPSMLNRARTLLLAASKLLTSEHPLEMPFAATWSTRSMATWVLLLLLGYLVFYFI